MSTLSTVRTFFRRSLRGARLDLATATAPARGLVASIGSRVSRTAESSSSSVETAPATSDSDATTTAVAPSPTQLDRIERAGEEHEQRDAALAHQLAGLPNALDSIPTLSHTMQAMADNVAREAEATREREDLLRSAIDRLDGAMARQTESLQLTASQLDASNRTIDELSDSIGDLATATQQLVVATAEGQRSLAQLAENTQRRDTEFATSMLRMQKWLTAAVLTCGGAAIAALMATIVAFL